MNFILKNNTLTFDSKFYFQRKWAAIFALTYANLTIGYHKIKVYSIIRQSYSFYPVIILKVADSDF